MSQDRDQIVSKTALELITFFKDRDIAPSDAAISMIRLMAMQLTFHSKDIVKLQRLISNLNLLLAMDVALFLLPADKIPQDNKEPQNDHTT